MKLSVLMLLEGTYPFYRGGVSTWVHDLISNLPDFDFSLLGITGNTNVEVKYNLPKNVKRLIFIPLWGAEMTEEYDNISALDVLRRTLRTRDKIVEKEFLPHFENLLKECMVGGRDLKKFGEALVGIYNFSKEHSQKKAFQTKIVWDTFFQMISGDPVYGKMSIIDSVEACRAFQFYLQILTRIPPKVDLCHSSAAALSGIPAIVMKIQRGTPYLLTEHGIYFRERVLGMIASNPIHKLFWINFIRALAKANYFYADKIVTVCNFNITWEKRLGVPLNKIETIYNGVNLERFKSKENVLKHDLSETVVCMSRIDRIKDLFNLIEAMKHVKQRFPNVKCKIFGPVEDEEYYRLCVQRVRKLGLEKTVTFEGDTNAPEDELNKADVVALPSLSEAFPYSVVEAMACGKVVVATDVGGVKEAINDCGIVVPARSSRRLAEGISRALADSSLREKISVSARERVEQHFSHDRFILDWRRAYAELLTDTKLERMATGGIGQFETCAR